MEKVLHMHEVRLAGLEEQKEAATLDVGEAMQGLEALSNELHSHESGEVANGAGVEGASRSSLELEHDASVEAGDDRNPIDDSGDCDAVNGADGVSDAMPRSEGSDAGAEDVVEDADAAERAWRAASEYRASSAAGSEDSFAGEGWSEGEDEPPGQESLS